MINTQLNGRVALVTGSNSPVGIGAGIARALAGEGVAVALAFLPGTTPEVDNGDTAARAYSEANSADGRQVRDELLAMGVRAEIFEVDLGDPNACVGLFDRVESTLGPVEILVNNAALCVPDTFVPSDVRSYHWQSAFVTADGLDAHLAVNTRAPALLMAEFHRRHLGRGANWGRVINISTDASPGARDQISYWASKHALESLSRSAALELGPAGITVNIISPGPVQTGWISEDMEAEFAKFSPLGRIGHPDDIADIAVFLASHQGRWVSGQNIMAGGGKRMS